MSEFYLEVVYPGSEFPTPGPAYTSKQVYEVPAGSVLEIASMQFNPSAPNGSAPDPEAWLFARDITSDPKVFGFGDGPTLARIGQGKRWDGKPLRGNGNNNAWLGRMGDGQTGPYVFPPWTEDFSLIGPAEIVLSAYTAEPTDQFFLRIKGVLTVL